MPSSFSAILFAAAAAAATAAAAANDDDLTTGHLPPEQRVHVFFYLWYGNPETDGRYTHWNHKILPHWTPRVNEQYDIGKAYTPPSSIHSPFYPKRGCYSSRDPLTVEAQLREIQQHGIGVVVLSWWGRPTHPGTSDTQGVSTDGAVSVILRAAEKIGIQVAFHLEPYPGRNVTTLRDDLKYLVDKYGSSKALAKIKNRPVYYVYDSYHISKGEWARLLTDDGDVSVRGGELDGVFIGLWLERHHGDELEAFDGFYTYFAARGFSYGSAPSNWKHMSAFAREKGKIFIASVGPGYDDTRIRPWNAQNLRDRSNGEYYDRMWSEALDAGAQVVSITSYNEWGEGTQIEPAIVRDGYKDYGSGGPGMFMERTKRWSEALSIAFRARRGGEVNEDDDPSPKVSGVKLADDL